jgi:hypothetical protein
MILRKPIHTKNNIKGVQTNHHEVLRLAMNTSSPIDIEQPGQTVELEIISLGELTTTDSLILCIDKPAFLTKSKDTKEKLAPESNKMRASKESTGKIPVTTSLRPPDSAEGKVYNPDGAHEAEAPTSCVEEVPTMDIVGAAGHW